MTALSFDSLQDKVSDQEFALAQFSTTYQPGAGTGSRIYPPTFPTSQQDKSPYLLEDRTYAGEIRKAVVLDQVPSQANRCDEALKLAWQEEKIRIPMLRLTHEGAAKVVITGLDAPHRAFDAYWRDSLLDQVKFDKTEIGRALQAASLEDATALLQYDPATLVYGGWNSHRKGRQAKFPRIYCSETIGWDPVVGTRKAGRMDPLNLTGARNGEGDEWTYSATAAKNEKAKLSEIGHGNIAPNAAHGGVTIAEAVRFSTLSLTALRRLHFGSLNSAAQLKARTLLASLALLGDRLAFGGAGVWLRSGCDLVVQSESSTWIGRGGVAEPFSLSADEAIALYNESFDAALAAGVPIHTAIVELTPSKALAEAIDFSMTKAESSGE